MKCDPPTVGFISSIWLQVHSDDESTVYDTEYKYENQHFLFFFTP